MDNNVSIRYIFKFNSQYKYRGQENLDNIEWFINYEPENVFCGDHIGDIQFGLVSDISEADLVSYPPDDWIQLDEKYKVGKILKVKVVIIQVECD